MPPLGSTLEAALADHRSGKIDRAEIRYREMLRVDPASAETHFHLGRALHDTGRLVEAAKSYREALRRNLEHPEVYCRLAAVMLRLDAADAAIACCRRVVEMQPDHAPAYFELANLLATDEQYDEAISAYQHALDIDPTFVDALNNMAMAFVRRGKIDEAISTYHRALRLEPKNAKLNANLGHILHSQSDFEQAILCFECALTDGPADAAIQLVLGKTYHKVDRLEDAFEAYQQSCRLDPDNAMPYYLSGNVQKDLAQYEDAIESYNRALALAPDMLLAHYNLGNAFRHLGWFNEARQCFERVLTFDSDHAPTLVTLGNLLKSQDNLSEAARLYRRVLPNQPDRHVWELWTASLCPAVFADVSEIDVYRQQLAEDIVRIKQMGCRVSPAEVSTAGCPAPYNLQFHSRSNRSIKEAYAGLFGDSLSQPKPLVNTGKPKIGFVVTDGHEGVFLRFLRGVIERMDRRRFDITVACSRNGTQRIRQRMNCDAVDVVVISHQFDRAVETLRSQKLDVLYHWEVGSDVINYFLPFAGLAAVQCTSAGLPETTGIAQMDYFLSSDLAEADDADSHYTETLIRAPSQLSYQRRLTLPSASKSREDFGFSSRDHLYVCAQKIEKFHPDFDALLAEILRRDKRGKVVIPRDSGGHKARKLEQRFASTMPDVLERIAFLPRLVMDDYLSLLSIADVLLDPLHYGGGLTAYDAFSLNKAVVTMPTQFVRGRYTYGFYRRMGLMSCVAGTPDEYVDIAVGMGADSARRIDFERQLYEATPLLFDDVQAVDDYENIFEQLIENSRE